MASWPTDPAEVRRWVAALTSPSTPDVREGGGAADSGGAAAPPPSAAAAAASLQPASSPGDARADAALSSSSPPPPTLVATVDLECPYLRDLVLAAFARRPAWTVIRADPVRTPLDPADVARAKPPKPSDDGNTTTDEEEEEGGWSGGSDDGSPAFTLTPHPAASASLFHWGEYERIDWGRVHAGRQAASSYCVRKGLTRKAHLAFALRKWASKRAGSSPAAAALAAATPETHVLQVDDPDYVEEALADLPEVRDAGPGRAGLWIAKPSLTNRGAGIAVVESVDGLRAALGAAAGASEWVVQRYVSPPHLLGGRKWHLRVYALAVGALEVWVCGGGGRGGGGGGGAGGGGGGALVLRARAPYVRPDGRVAPLDDLDAHLTNTCRERGGGAKPKPRKKGGGRGGLLAAAGRWAGRWLGGGEAADAPPRPSDPVAAGLALSLADLPAALVAENGMDRAEAEARAARLAEQAGALVGEAFAAASAELSFFPLPSAWELFGFDLMVDAAWKPYLLEANADPDVGASGEGLRGVIGGLVEGTLARTADRVAAAAAAGEAQPAILSPGGWEGEGDALLSGGWARVFVRDAGRGGASGMRVE